MVLRHWNVRSFLGCISSAFLTAEECFSNVPTPLPKMAVHICWRLWVCSSQSSRLGLCTLADLPGLGVVPVGLLYFPYSRHADNTLYSLRVNLNYPSCGCWSHVLDASLSQIARCSGDGFEWVAQGYLDDLGCHSVSPAGYRPSCQFVIASWYTGSSSNQSSSGRLRVQSQVSMHFEFFEAADEVPQTLGARALAFVVWFCRPSVIPRRSSAFCFSVGPSYSPASQLRFSRVRFCLRRSTAFDVLLVVVRVPDTAPNVSAVSVLGAVAREVA